VPAVAVNQEGQVVLSRNRLKGCVGSFYNLIQKSSILIEVQNLYYLKWNFIGDAGIVNVVEAEFLEINRNA
jgi:hypothetical protein